MTLRVLHRYGTRLEATDVADQQKEATSRLPLFVGGACLTKVEPQ